MNSLNFTDAQMALLAQALRSLDDARNQLISDINAQMAEAAERKAEEARAAREAMKEEAAKAAEVQAQEQELAKAAAERAAQAQEQETEMAKAAAERAAHEKGQDEAVDAIVPDEELKGNGHTS